MREKVEFPPGFLDPGLPKGVFSHSQYNLYRNCPQSYEREYVLGMRSPMGSRAYKGVAVHAGAEFALRHVMANNAPPPLEAGMEKVSSVFSERSEEVIWDDEDKGKAKDLSLAAYAEWHRQVLVKRKIKPVAVEELFLQKVGSVPVMGYIDLIEHVQGPARAGIPDPGFMVIADLKTGSTAWTQADLDKDTQFSLYALVRGIYRVRVDSIAFLKAGPTYSSKEATREELALRVLVEDYEEVVSLIKRGIFPRTSIDAWNCSAKWCSHWTRCRGNAARYLPVI